MSYAYRIVGGKEHEQSLFFMLNSLLKSRIDIGDETTDDEDVNVYLASLLHSLVDKVPAQSEVSTYDTDVARMAEGRDLRSRFQVYRANADHALVAVAVFDGPWFDRRTPDRAALEARGKCYYTAAASIEQKLRFGSSAVSDVLSKLSERFDLYVRILGRVRSSYLNLSARMSAGEAFHLERHAQEGARPALIKYGRDQFLDAYGDWMATASATVKRRVNRIGESLAELDPEFRFDGI